MEVPTMDLGELNFKKNFEEKLYDYEIHHQGSLRKPWTNDRILEVISKIKNARVAMTNTHCRTSMSYYWLSKYDLATIDNEEYLIFKRKNPEDPVIRIIPREEYFNILNSVHKDCGHGGRDKMVYSIKSRYYIVKKAIEIYVSLCPSCNTKRKVPKKDTVAQPIVSEDFNNQGQIELIDFQSCPDGEYKWLLIYQDNSTKFLILRSLKSKMAHEVAMELTKIFLTFGAPRILQSDNEQEFTAKLIEELVAMWPNCKIVHGITQGTLERSTQHVDSMIRSWMIDNNSTKWSVGCLFCQYTINSTFHQTIGRSPYKALFGTDPKLILSGTNVDSQFLISNIKTEEHLENHTNEPSDEDGPHQSIKTDSHLNAKVISDEKLCSLETKSFQPNISQNDETQIAETSHNINQLWVDEFSLSNIKSEKMKNETQIAETSHNINQLGVDESSLSNIKSENDTANVGNNNEEVSNYLEIKIEPNLLCIVCQKPTTDAHSCRSCNNAVHILCGLSEEGEEGYHSNVLCMRCKMEEEIIVLRNEAHKGLKRAAEKLVENTIKKLPHLTLGKGVLVNVPKVDRGPLGIKNIRGKIVDCQNGVFRVGTKTGTIKNWFGQQDLHPLMDSYDDEILDIPISLQEAVNNESKLGGQEYQKCMCKPARNQCRTFRCACFKKKLSCGSKCHSSLSCVNK